MKNSYFNASGRLQLDITSHWGADSVHTFKDTPGAPLEEQLPLLIRKLEISQAEQDWKGREERRRAPIRQERWEAVKREAFVRLSYAHNAERLDDQLARRAFPAQMRTYADEITARATTMATDAATSAVAWADWIRKHADSTDPLNGDLRTVITTRASHEELEPHMDGRSPHGPHRRTMGDPW